MDVDFVCPPLLLKYFCLLFAGFAWNKEAIIDMLQINEIDKNSTENNGNSNDYITDYNETNENNENISNKNNTGNKENTIKSNRNSRNNQEIHHTFLDTSILKEVISLLLFSRNLISDPPLPACVTILNIFTGKYY